MTRLQIEIDVDENLISEEDLEASLMQLPGVEVLDIFEDDDIDPFHQFPTHEVD